MTPIQVAELAAELFTAAIEAFKSGATNVSIDALIAKHTAGEAKDDADIRAAADAKFGTGSKATP